MLQVARDDANLSKGYGFVSFSNFEASDEAVANMNGQYLMNKEISVQYAYKKDGKGERHGDQAERILAAQARKHNVQPTAQPIPMGLFTGGAPSAPAAMDGVRAGNVPAASPGGYVPGRPPVPSVNNQGFPPPGQQRPPPPSQPLPAPPSGLPARPPLTSRLWGPARLPTSGLQWTTSTRFSTTASCSSARLRSSRLCPWAPTRTSTSFSDTGLRKSEVIL